MQTILELAQEASDTAGFARPTTLFASSDPEGLELASVVNEAARMIVEAHDWQLLTQQGAATGDGSNSEFNVADDFLRVPDAVRVWSDDRTYPWTRIVDHDTWLAAQHQNGSLLQTVYTVRGNIFAFSPAPADGEVLRIPYISRNYALDSAEVAKDAFTSESDTWRLDDRLLRLAVVMVWRKERGLESEFSERQFGLALEEAVKADKGLSTQAPQIGTRGGAAETYSRPVQP